MVIDQIDVYYVVLPLNFPWRTAYGEDNDIHTILVRMLSGENEGWGETSPLVAPTFSSEFAFSAFYLIKNLFAPSIVGSDISTPDRLQVRLRQFKGNQFAKAGIESAWWILKANLDRKPLHYLLGGESRPVDAGADFGIHDSVEILLGKIHNSVEQGYKRIKLKIKHGWDLDILTIVRSSFPGLTLHIDCNASYSLDDMDFFRAVDRLGLAMIEQPLSSDDLLNHSYLQKKIRTPLCLDESIKSIKDFELALHLGSCQYLNIKYSRVGGLSNAIKLHNLAQDSGIPCWVGGMLESSIGSGINIELATLPNFTYPGDLFESKFFYNQDLTHTEVKMNANCTFTPSNVPGIPYKPNLDRIDKYSRWKGSIKKGDQ